MNNVTKTNIPLFPLSLLMIGFMSYSMDTPEDNPKPIVYGNLYIDHADYKARYTGSNYHEWCTKAGIPSQLKDPMIAILFFDNENCNWTKMPVHIIQQHELKQISDPQEAQLRAIMKKQLPHSIPASLLMGKKSGDVLDLTVYGYRVKATCTTNPRTNVDFAKDYESHMEKFTQKPSYFDYNFHNSQDELIKAGLIDKNGNHGPNGLKTNNPVLNFAEKTVKRTAWRYFSMLKKFTIPGLSLVGIAIIFTWLHKMYPQFLAQK